MKEFGSDFHTMLNFCNTAAESSKVTLYDVHKCMREYACGRHAIEAICKYKNWKRIWIPAYFCYDVIEYLVKTGIEIKLYDDSPVKDSDDQEVRNLPYKDGDVLLRINYFDHRKYRTNKGISIPVIEDHTHDIISEWARNSDSSYCIASIRKTMPTAAGGILWSPMGLDLPETIGETDECKAMAIMRYEGMDMKREYLKGKLVDKDKFRKKFQISEKIIEKLQLSGMDKETLTIAKKMNYLLWNELKADNWRIANEILVQKFRVLKPYDPFSIIILCDNTKEREALRMHLINNMIYPAILWQMPEDSVFEVAKDFSKRMLSVHCDPRYSRNDIKEMCERILAFEG